MAGDGVELVGPDLSGGLGKLARAVAHLAPTEHEGAALAAQAVRKRSPRKSGSLAASVTVTEATVRTGARHAGPLEFGTGPRVGQRGPHNIRATRFQVKGLQDATPAIGRLFTTQLTQDVNRVRNG